MNQLTGITVVELASVLAGPSVGQFFAELGASVIKIENIIGGDVTRSWKSSKEMSDDRSAYFTAVNWGKKSLAVDLHLQEGQQIVHALVKDADLVIASYKPGDASKLRVDYKTLSGLNPKLIYGQITGYGSRNQRVGYDAVIQAEAGFMYMNGEKGGSSLKMPVALIDILAGHQLKEGLLLALLKRERTGSGSFVEVSLIQAAIASLANQATNWLVGGLLPEKQGSAHPNIAPYGEVYLTKDGKEILLAVGSDKQFYELLNILDLKHLLKDKRFATNTSRVRNRAALNDVLSERVAGIESSTLLENLRRANVPAGLIRNMEEVFASTEAQELLLKHASFTGVKTFVAVSNEQNLSSSSHILPPPRLGEHTVEILINSLGFSSENVEKLRSRKVVL